MRPRWCRHSANIAIGQGCLPAPMKCRITMLFAAVHDSVVGTFETCGRTLSMSVDRARPEAAGRRLT
jgi:hypothetical protein